MKTKLVLVAMALMLSACVTPVSREKNPNVAKRPTSTKKFLGKNDYYLDENAPKKNLEKHESLAEENAMLVPEYPLSRHKVKVESFGGFEGNYTDELIEAEPEEVIKEIRDRTMLYDEEGLASWYGPGFHGRKTANGEKFNQHHMTAAHRKLPMGSKVEVTNLRNGRSVIVRINDRGPYSGRRIIDLSKAAAQELDIINHGVARVRVKQLED